MARFIGYSFRVLLWKELLDLSRDYKTIATSLLLPVLFFPLLGFLSLTLVSQQPVSVAIVDLDHNISYNPLLNMSVSSMELVSRLKKAFRSTGISVVETSNTSIVSDPDIDLVVVIPRGFAENASSINKTARVVVYRKAALQASTRAESIAYAVINGFSSELSRNKTGKLIEIAGINGSVTSFLQPINPQTMVVTIKGGKAGAKEELRGVLARILVLALSVVITPATSYIIDGIIGERERKTIEMVLSQPVSVHLIIYTKLFAATMLGLLTALADALGFIAYIVLTNMALGGSTTIPIDPWLLLLHSLVAFFTILVTIGISLPFITRTRGIRSAANIASAIAVIGTMMFFTGFLVDYVRLSPGIKTGLYIIPYTHSILAIQYYVLGEVTTAMIHIGFLAVLSIALIVLSTKTISAEKLLVAPRT